MMKRAKWKLALDALMLIILLLMYRKNVLGMTFHEVGGLAVCGLFIIHILLNGNWVLAVTGKLFSRKTGWKMKLNWLIDFLLLLCFVYILVSGILISEVVFEGQQGMHSFKTGHYAVSALALILLGVHMGLHYESIVNRTPARRVPLQLRRVTAVLLSAAILGAGAYTLGTSSFLNWFGNLGSVFGMSSPLQTDGLRAVPQGDADETLSADFTAGENLTPPDSDESETAETRPSRGNGEGEGNGQGKGDGMPADYSQLGEVLLGFLSITLLPAVVIAWIEGIRRSGKRKKLLTETQQA